jgi:hypothetical protein
MGLDTLSDWSSPVPFAQRAWHRCSSCRYDEGRGDGHGTPPWHVCTLDRGLPGSTNDGHDCNRYSPLPWAVAPSTHEPAGEKS